MSLSKWRGGESPWPERDAELIAWWESGAGPVAIEREMHLTNGQIMGRINRLCHKGILAWRGPRKPEPTLQSKKRRERRERAAARLPVGLPVPKLPPLASVAKAPVAVVVSPPLHSTRTCQWVMSERPVAYCDAPCCHRRNFDGTWRVTSWCATHYARVYQPSLRQQGLPRVLETAS